MSVSGGIGKSFLEGVPGKTAGATALEADAPLLDSVGAATCSRIEVVGDCN